METYITIKLYNMKSLTFILLILLAGVSVKAQMAQTQTVDNGQEILVKFFDLYKAKGYEYALKYAFETNKWIKSEGTEMLNVSLALGKMVQPLGEYLGSEEIRSKTISSRLRIVSYFVYYQREPVRFTFELYKNATGWEIWDLQFDTDFDAEVMDAMRFSSHNIEVGR